jgi:hypothetical protein
MKRYYDVYVRPAGAEIDDAAVATGNILSGWDKIDLADQGANLGTEPEKRVLGDGTEYIEAEITNFKTDTLRVDAEEYAYLRSTFHNLAVDVMLYDPNDHMIVAISYRMRMQVVPMHEGDASSLIKLTAMRKSADANMTVLQSSTLDNYGVLRGKIYAEDNVTPVEGVLVSITVATVDYDDLSDKDGEFMLCLPEGTHTFTPTLTGGWVFPECEIAVGSAMETTLDIVATTDGS